jgi:CheY-like chemotaxis protein
MALILVIDDDESIRKAVRTLLVHRGVDVLAADSGAAGIKYLESFAIDAAIVDIFMPGMDGLEIIRAFSQRVPRVPVIAMSGGLFRDRHGTAPDFLCMAGRLGADFCLRKPFRPDQMMAAVEACLGAPLGVPELNAMVVPPGSVPARNPPKNSPRLATCSRVGALEA